MADEQKDISLNVRNRGFDRFGVTPAPFASEEELLSANALSPQPVVTVPATRSDMPWAKLAWWESEWQAAKGIEATCSRPFLHLGRDIHHPNQPVLVPTRVLYPYAFVSSDRPRIEETPRFVAAMVRQAREFYSAAASTGVSDLSRPVLYFYGALALAKAATVALFGRDQLEKKGHGLESTSGPSTRHATAPWPNVIHWRQSGEFVMLYRAAR